MEIVSKINAELLEYNPKNIEKCVNDINNGNLVIFPTETVYGLGANALNKDAIDKIYKLKKRPKNNPLIVHVSDWNMASIYCEINNNEKHIIEKLVNEFWPGPLTLLLKKSKFINDCITAGSEFVGLRCPDNKIAQELIRKSMCPIAAPSANISGKITSTHYKHLLEYFRNENINIIYEKEPCRYGIESTILKIENDNITIIRPGVITKKNIENVLPEVTVNYKSVIQQSNSPGTDLSHYQLNKNTLLFNFIDMELLDCDKNTMENIIQMTTKYMDNSICIDFGKKNIKNRDLFAGYVDLSADGDIKEACFNLYNVLHQLNSIDNIKNVLIFDFYYGKDGMYKTMFDRIFRCSAGKRICIPTSHRRMAESL